MIMQATVSIVFFTQKPLWNFKKKAQLMSASDGSKNSDESDWGWIKRKKEFELARIEKAWAGARNWQCAGTMELQYYGIIRNRTEIPRKLNAKLLNWKTMQEAVEQVCSKKKCLLLQKQGHTHTHWSGKD